MRYQDKLFNARGVSNLQLTGPVDLWVRLERFLILGEETATYFVEREPLTAALAQAALDCLKQDGRRVVNAVIDISGSGRAPHSEPALFILALAASPAFADAHTNAAALSALTLVARTGTQLCTFAGFVEGLRGWGRGLRSAVSDWYLSRPVKELAAQMLKHPQRNGWSHRDLLRMAHPKSVTPEQNSLFRWAIDSEIGSLAPEELDQVYGFELVKRASTEEDIVSLIEDYGLSHEMIPARWKNSAAVWEALLAEMSYPATLRHLGKLTSVGLIGPESPATALVVARLIDRRRVERAKVHPIAILAALWNYKNGSPEAVKAIVDALEEAYYLSLVNVKPIERRIYFALDASESMRNLACQGTPALTAHLGSWAFAQVCALTEPTVIVSAFHDRLWNLNLVREGRRTKLEIPVTSGAARLDASLLFEDALQRGLEVDAFIVMTGDQTLAASDALTQALAKYRRDSGVGSKLVLVSMSAKRANYPVSSDPLRLDVAGFDASVPGIIHGFIGP